MNTIVVYDIVGNRRRAKFHKYMKELGLQSQYSVFECRLDHREIREIRGYCRTVLALAEDSVRIYHVCRGCMAKAVLQGQGVSLPQLDWLVL